MKKYFILFLLPFAIWGCRKDVFINEFSFYVDGVYYEFNTLEEYFPNGGYIKTAEFAVEGFRYSPSSPIDSLFYLFMGYNVSTCESCDCGYGGGFIDRSAQKETIFNMPDGSIFFSWFWIEIDCVTYDAISGYIEMINIDVEAEQNKSTLNRNNYKAYGTFEFVMVNEENPLDTIHVKNGKFRYQCYAYSEAYQTFP